LFDKPFPAALIKMAYAQKRDEEYVSSILEYYKVVYFKELYCYSSNFGIQLWYSNGLRLFGNPLVVH
jgi:hypothetical protein